MKLFVSYSQKDSSYKSELVTYLAPLLSARGLALWERGKTLGGDPSWALVAEEIRRADAILSLVSADYLNPEDDASREIAFVLAESKKRPVRIIPILVRDCFVQGVDWLDNRQMLPRSGRSLFSARNRPEEWTDVCKEIARIASADRPPPQTDPASTSDADLLSAVVLEGPFDQIPPGLQKELQEQFPDVATVKQIVSQAVLLMRAHCPGAMPLSVSFLSDASGRAIWWSVLSEGPKVGAKAFLAVLLCARALTDNKLPLLEATIHRLIMARDAGP